MRVEPIEHAKALRGMIEPCHAVRKRLYGVAGLHRDDLDTKRARGLDFLKRQSAERIDGLARIPLGLCGLLPVSENEALYVGAESQREHLELPLIAVGAGGGGGETVDRKVFR